jgi:hypothetical protein
MSRHGVALLLIGLGVGIIGVTLVALAYFAWWHHMFIIGLQWSSRSILLASPFLLILVGLVFLRRSKSGDEQVTSR